MTADNVIHVDFRKPEPAILTVSLKTDILYIDADVILVRVTYLLDGKTGRADHFLLAANA